MKITVKLPGSWADVTLRQYLQYIEVLLPSAPDLGDGVPEHEYHALMLPWFVRLIAHFSGVPAEKIMLGSHAGNAVKQIERSAAWLTRVLRFPEEKDFPYRREVVFKGETYYLPPLLMQGCTVAEWVESAELLRQSEKAELSAIPRLLCILLRKKGEAYSDALMARQAHFLDLPMSEAWRVWFFFAHQTEVFARTFLSYSTDPEKALKLSQGLKGWTA